MNSLSKKKLYGKTDWEHHNLTTVQNEEIHEFLDTEVEVFKGFKTKKISK